MTRPRHITSALGLALALAHVAAPAQAQDLGERQRVEVARRLSASTVAVQVGPGGGSGFVTGPERWVVTNAHVVAAARRGPVRIRFSGGARGEAQVAFIDPSRDLAILEVRGEVPAPGLPLGDSDAVEVGQTVLAYGSPFGLDGTLTQGIVSARRDLPRLAVRRLIQTDATINPGNSGGPLVNSQGEVVGVNTAIFSRTGGSHGIGFAIPSNEVQSVLEALRGSRRGAASAEASPPDPERRAAGPDSAPPRDEARSGPPAFLGIAGHDFAVGRVRGVRIIEVVRGGPAERAGLAGANDAPPDSIRALRVPWTGHIIVALDGRPVRSMADLQRILGAYSPGDELVVTATVAGAVSGRTRVVLAEAPADDDD